MVEGFQGLGRLGSRVFRVIGFGHNVEGLL